MRTPNIFLDSGYLDFERGILSVPATYYWIIGGRGIGKTFSALKWAYENKIKFLFLKRTETQLKLLSKKDTNPFKNLNRAGVSNVTTSPISEKLHGFYEMDSDYKAIGEPIGYMAPLSTFASMKGSSYEDVEVVIYDEFIKEAHEKRIESEAKALMNALETIGRNRELEGKPPLKLIALSNSNDIANDYFFYLNLVTLLEKMAKNEKTMTYLPERECVIFNIMNSPISEKKKETSLYKLTKGTDFYEMSVNNSYNVDFSRYSGRNIKGMTPVLTVGEITLYEKDNEYYFTPFKSGGKCDLYPATPEGLRVFKTENRWLLALYNLDELQFETYYTEECFRHYWTM